MNPSSPLRVAIVDDEPLARLRLRHLMQQMSDPLCEVVGEAGHAQQTWELMQQVSCDAVLLDIRMPGLDGLQLARQLGAAGAGGRPPAVIFVTAHAEHALQAFELQALDYLTKPVQLARLQQALRRVRLARDSVTPGPATTSDALPAPLQPDVLVISDRQRLLRIPLADIVMVRAGLKRVTLTTLTREHVIDESLADLELRLGAGFVRVSRGALVARHAARELVRSASRSGSAGLLSSPRGAGSAADLGGHSVEALEEGWALRVAPGDVWLPVSRRLVASVREALGSR